MDGFVFDQDGFETLADSSLAACRLCPRECGIDRRREVGFCGCQGEVRAARAALHLWEEPWISGVRGSGTVFFSGCTLRCCFCQNYRISQENFGKALTVGELADVFLRLQEQGAHNINLVTATQFLPWILPALDRVRHRLWIPVVYNCGGYERVEIVRALADYVDIWLPDLKYFDPQLSARYSRAPDYFAVASRAVRQMVAQTGKPVFYSKGLDRQNRHSCQDSRLGLTPCGSWDSVDQPRMRRGVIIRHMVLPGHREDSIRLLHWIADNLPRGQYFISLLSQYTPYCKNREFPELNRRVTTYEYRNVVDTALELGLDQGFMQEKTSAREEYTPPFDLEGL